MNCTTYFKNIAIQLMGPGLQELEILVRFFHAPTCLHTQSYTSHYVHLKQSFVHVYMYTNMYLTVHPLQRQKYFRVEVKLKVCSSNHQHLGIQTAFIEKETTEQSLVKPEPNKQLDNFSSIGFECNKHFWSFPMLKFLQMAGKCMMYS